MTKWEQIYQSKLVSAQEAAQALKSGDNIFLPIGAGDAPAVLEAMAERKDELEGVSVHQMLPLRNLTYLQPGMEKHFRSNGWFLSGLNRGLAQQGLADVTPNFFYDSPRLITEYWDVDVVMATVSPMDEHGFFSFGVNVDYISTAAQKAKIVILEVNPSMPRSFGDSFIHVSDATFLVENNIPIPEIPPAPVSQLDRVIGNYIAELVEDGSTIQLGIGGIPQATAQCLLSKRDLGVHTEMITDSIMDLVEAGAANGSKKTMNRGKVVGTFALGTRKLYDFIHNNPAVELYPVSYTNDPAVIGRQHKMVTINAAIEVDLLGQCASESIGHAQFSGTGGQADFSHGAIRSPGGKGFITIPSTTKGGTISRIVATLKPGAVVTTSKNAVDYVVTEYGVAKLRGKTLRQRAEALIAIAHPDFRGQLREEGRKLQIL